jgi:asparagine synthetase B (glutamine-hydrolysing)
MCGTVGRLTWGGCADPDPDQRANIAEHLPNDILAKADRMSMAHRLEVRVPFLAIDPAAVGGVWRDHLSGGRSWGFEVWGLRVLSARNRSRVARAPRFASGTRPARRDIPFGHSSTTGGRRHASGDGAREGRRP